MICLRELSFIVAIVLTVLCCVESGYVNEGLKTPVADGFKGDSVVALEDHREKRSDGTGYLDRVAKYLTENLNVEFDRLVNKTMTEVYGGYDKFGEFDLDGKCITPVHQSCDLRKLTCEMTGDQTFNWLKMK